MLGVEPSYADAAFVEWEDWVIGPTDGAHPVTHGLHVGFRAPSREGGPGERAVYHAGYYAAFALDPDGHNVEVVDHNSRASSGAWPGDGSSTASESRPPIVSARGHGCRRRPCRWSIADFRRSSATRTATPG